jgi:prevent-host-death family protein
MCYMSSRGRTVGVRDLRQNLSVYLREVEAGTSFEVTARGRRVALLSPLPVEASTWDRLLAEGSVSAAERPTSTLPRPLPANGGRSISQALREVREDRL